MAQPTQEKDATRAAPLGASKLAHELPLHTSSAPFFLLVGVASEEVFMDRSRDALFEKGGWTMHRWISVAVALLVLSAPASAQTTKALDLVPDDALGFVLIKDLRQLSDRVEQVAKKLEVPERVSLLELIQEQMGIREGLNDKGSAIFIVLKGKTEEPMLNPVFAVAIADYQKVAQQLGVKQPKEGINQGEMGAMSRLLAGIGGHGPEKTKKSAVLVAKRGDFVLLASPDNRQGLETILSSRKSIAASLQTAQDWLAEQDVCGVCTEHGVKVGLGMFFGGPGGAAQSTTPGQAARIKETYAEVEKNLKLVAFGGRIEKAGHWRLLTRAYFEPQGPYAKWLAKAEPADGTLLAQLPDQPYMLAALARISAQTSFEGAVRLISGHLTTETDEKWAKSAAQLLQRISEVGLGVYVDRQEKKDLGRELNLLARVDDAPAFVEAAVDLVKQFVPATSGKDKTDVVTYELVKLAGKPSRLIRAQSKTEPKSDTKESRARTLAVLLTEMDSKTVLVAVLKDAAQAEATVKKIVDASARPLARNQELQKTVALLPGKLQLAAYFNIDRWLIGFAGLEGTAECPPLGFALRTVPAAIEAQFVIPFESIQAVSKTWNAQRKRETKEKQ
jgi:hypothetical protein